MPSPEQVRYNNAAAKASEKNPVLYWGRQEKEFEVTLALWKLLHYKDLYLEVIK